MHRVAHLKVFRTVLLLSFVLSLLGASFSFASAEEIAQSSAAQSLVPKVVTQTLSPSSVACETPAISGLKTYVYEGSLHSFEITVSDATQVALAGSAGDAPISFHYIHRTAGESGSVKMFVGIPSQRVGAELPVSLTTLSAKGAGQPVCVTTVSFTLRGEAESAAGTLPSGSSASTKGVGNTWSAEWGGKAIGDLWTTLVNKASDALDQPAAEKKEVAATKTRGEDPKESGWKAAFSDFEKEGRESILKRAGMAVAVKESVGGVCAEKNGASRLWLVLLAAYAIWALLLNTHRRFLKDRVLQNAAVVAPFVVLVALWYFIPECRVGWWTLAGATVVAFAAIFGKTHWKEFADKNTSPWTTFHP